MRALSFFFLIVLSEAKDFKKKPDYDDEVPSPIQRKIDVYPQSFSEPVPFGHITLEGFGDPFSPAKPPLDLLELDMILPKTSEEARELLKKGISNIQYIKSNIPRGFANPRDKYLNGITFVNPEDTNGTNLKWYNIAEVQRKNVMMPAQTRGLPKRRTRPDPPRRMSAPQKPSSEPKAQYFSKHMFELKQHQRTRKINWTTCDEFGKRAIFSPKDIVNIDWVPFYIWSIEGYPIAIVYRFKYPTQKLVKEFRERYGMFLNKTIDWTQTKLYMTGMHEMLLIAADKKGLFDAIPKHEIPDNTQHVKIPVVKLRMKIEDPYLVLTFCDDFFAAVMAISGTEPTIFAEMKAEAASIKFVGPGQPAWRDLEGEKEKARLERERKIAAEQEKIIKIDLQMPPIGQFD